MSGIVVDFFFDTDDEDFVKPKVDVMKLSSMKKRLVTSFLL